MQFNIVYFNKTPLFIAAEKGSTESVQSLLGHPDIDVNSSSILNIILF